MGVCKKKTVVGEWDAPKGRGKYPWNGGKCVFPRAFGIVPNKG